MSARTPEDVDRLFGEFLNSGSLEGLVSLYEAGAAFVPQEGDAIVGRDGIREALSGFVAMKPRIKMNVVRVVSMGDDLAMLYNDWSLAATGPDGKPAETSGKATEIVRRQKDGTWLFVCDAPFMRS